MQGQKHILVVDNDNVRRDQIATVLAFVGEHFHACAEKEVSQYLSETDNILTVILCGEISESLVSLVKQLPATPFILHDVLDETQLNEALNVLGCLAVPLNYAQLTEQVHHCHQYHNQLPSKRSYSGPNPLFRSLVGTSEPMLQVRFLIEQVAKTQASVLILGESGTGKELVAQALHKHSPRRENKFIALNMAAIPNDLIESELFGHEKGAFTGAAQRREGRFEQSDGGTLFLDEIGDMPPEAQTRLLRVLADGEFYRVGGHTAVKVDVRIIAATHQNLEQLVAENRFREDLFHRLNVIRVHLPKLADRREDIPQLMQHFFYRAAKELDMEPKTLSQEAEDFFFNLAWPGNVRQLENICRWLTVMAAGREVLLTDLPPELQAEDAESESRTQGDWQQMLKRWSERELKLGRSDILAQAIPEFERTMIETALAHTGGRKKDAAELLGWGRNTLTRKLQEYSMESKAL